MGRMVADTRAAVSAVAGINIVDPARVYVAGYALGGKVGLIAAALDEKIAGAASLFGFAPLRLDKPEKGTEGVRHYSHVHGLIPRFGFFEGHESRLPIDWDEILAAIAPRPVYVIAPTLDRYSPVEDVRRAVGAARKAYEIAGAPSALRLDTPVNFNRFPPEIRDEMVKWLADLAGIDTSGLY